MKAPDVPSNEETRLAELEGLCVLDTPPEERFDRYTRLAQRLFDVPIALVSLVDENRQWFKSRQGLAAAQTGRDISFCGHAIVQADPLVVEDAAADPRFEDNPLVTGDPKIRFYAGYPLRTPSGLALGTLCVIDREPRSFSDDDLATLRDIGEMVAGELASLMLATTDELTGLSNRRGFEVLCRQALAMCARAGQRATVVAIDLDGMKRINDEHGHQAGDEALKTFAALLLETFRDSDVVARLGGDEFAALLAGTALERAEIALGRLRYAMDIHNAAVPAARQFCFSAGVAEHKPGQHLEMLLAEADSLMYRDKANKRRKSAKPSWRGPDDTASIRSL